MDTLKIKNEAYFLTEKFSACNALAYEWLLT
jgi:hypothetical protein